MQYIVDLVLASGIAVGVEETLWKVGAGENGETNLFDRGVFLRCSLSTTYRGCILGVANVELVVVGGERFKAIRLDLFCLSKTSIMLITAAQTLTVQSTS